VAFLFIAFISGAVGFGMRNLKVWGRILQIVFAGFGATFQVLGLLISLIHARVGAMLWNLIWLSFIVWIINYLIQPRGKAAFAQPGPMQQAFGR
jgi:hypothetical protein